MEVIIGCLEKMGQQSIKKSHKGNYYLLFNKPPKSSPQEKLLNEIKKTKAGMMHLEEAAFLEELGYKLQEGNYNKFSLFADIL